MKGTQSSKCGDRTSKKWKLKKKRSRDDAGGLEGLPLQLIIMVVIAGVGISIVVAWLTVFSEKPLNSIELEGIQPTPANTNTLTNGQTYEIKLRAVNTDNKPMSDVTVILEGPGVSRIASTDSSGVATFSGVTPDLAVNKGYGQISVTGEYKSITVSGLSINVQA